MKLDNTQLIFSALSDQTRFRILNLLSAGELCVCDLMKVLKEPQTKVSRHLSYLRRARLVESRKEGLWMHYRLAKPSSRTLRSIFSVINCCRADCRELANDFKEFRKKRKTLASCC